MKKLAIIGASYLQVPLILKAKEMGMETHVFAWQLGDEGERIADRFYPISIVEKEEIAERCAEIGIDGVCSIASDLAAITVNYVANRLGLTGNSLECTKKSTNKHIMRLAFEANGDPSPKSIIVNSAEDITEAGMRFPIIIKPSDRSGSRGIMKLESLCGAENAIKLAKEQSFADEAVAEEFVEGKEYSIEGISYRGTHHILTVTEKFTTGAPNFIETGHLQPADLPGDITDKIRKVVIHALDSLEIENGASHSEIKINSMGEIYLIEIGGRMGGDEIGSDLVPLTIGYDYIKAVIQIAMGEKPELNTAPNGTVAAVRFFLDEMDDEAFTRLRKNDPCMLVRYEKTGSDLLPVKDSSSRHGMFIFAGKERERIREYLPGM